MPIANHKRWRVAIPLACSLTCALPALAAEGPAIHESGSIANLGAAANAFDLANLSAAADDNQPAEPVLAVPDSSPVQGPPQAPDVPVTPVDAPPPRLKWKDVKHLEIAYQVMNVLDVIETIYCRDADKCHESNPLLGRNISDGKLIGVKIAGGILHYAISRTLVRRNSSLARPWLVGTLIVQSGVVALNLRHCF